MTAHEAGEAAHPFDTLSPTLTRRALDEAKLLSGNYWRESRAFLAVAKARSYSRAAGEMQATHTTVSRLVRHLETQVGERLVTSSNQGVSLTPKGLVLAKALLRIDQQLSSLFSNLKSLRSSAEGVVRVGVTDGLAVVFVVPALYKFSLRYPNLQLQIKSPGNLKDLRENQTDITLGFSPTTAADFLSRPLGWLHFLPVAGRDYVERMGLPTLETVEQHRFLDSEIYSSRAGTWDAWHQLVARGRVAHHADATFTYAMMVKAGLGIGLLANYTMLEPAYVPLDLGVRTSLRLHALAVAERLESPAVQLVFDGLAELFGPANPWFAPDMRLNVDHPVYKEGYAKLFNLA